MNIRLEQMRIEDCDNEEYLSWLNNKDTTQWLSTKSGTRDSARRYVSERINSFGQGMYKIIVEEVSQQGRYTSSWVGTCVYYDLSLSKNIVTLGIMIGKRDIHGKGIGRKALKMLIKEINNKYGITTFTIGCYCENIAAEQCYLKTGFKKSQFLFIGSFEELTKE